MVHRYKGKGRVPRDATIICVEPAVTKIEDRAFFECASLREIQIEGNIVEVGVYAFFGCTSLRTIKMPQVFQKLALVHSMAVHLCNQSKFHMELKS